MIRVLVADGSLMQRELLRALLGGVSDFEVVSSARDGAEAARETARLRPDIVLMDSALPGIGALEAIRIIMRECPTPIVIANSTAAHRDAGIPFEAVKCGALSVVNTPAGDGTSADAQAMQELTRTLRLMSEVKVVGRRISRLAKKTSPGAGAARRTLDVIAICGSTGAPAVIAEIVGALKSPRTPPILIVQHLTRGYAPRFAEWLAAKTSLHVQIAANDAVVRPANIYLAPDDCQMGLRVSGRIRLTADPLEDGFQPSASYLLRTLAKSYGPRAMGVLLTGMGHDGAKGLLALRQAGGLTVAQSQESCVVYGMPHVAVKLGAAVEVLPPHDIIKLIKSKKSADMETTDVSRNVPSHL